MNELLCYGCRLKIRTKAFDLDTAVQELEEMLFRMDIDVELNGMMKLTDGADRVLEEC